MAYILVVHDSIEYFLVFHSLIARQTNDQLNVSRCEDGASKSRQKWATNVVREKKVTLQIRHPRSKGVSW